MIRGIILYGTRSGIEEKIRVPERVRAVMKPVPEGMFIHFIRAYIHNFYRGRAMDGCTNECNKFVIFL